jgi:hypothetical protein
MIALSFEASFDPGLGGENPPCPCIASRYIPTSLIYIQQCGTFDKGGMAEGSPLARGFETYLLSNKGIRS